MGKDTSKIVIIALLLLLTMLGGCYYSQQGGIHNQTTTTTTLVTTTTVPHDWCWDKCISYGFDAGGHEGTDCEYPEVDIEVQGDIAGRHCCCLKSNYHCINGDEQVGSLNNQSLIPSSCHDYAGLYYDYCAYSEGLVEYVCELDVCTPKWVKCRDAVYNGMCVPSGLSAKCETTG